MKEVDPKDFFGLAAKKVKPKGKIRILSKFYTENVSILTGDVMATMTVAITVTKKIVGVN